MIYITLRREEFTQYTAYPAIPYKHHWASCRGKLLQERD